MSRIAQFAEYGAPEVVRVVDAPAPAPGPTQVRIAVRAAGVNPIDWKILAGYMRELMPLELPAGLGSDVAGAVDAVGSEVTEWAVGDEVLGRSTTGSFADLTLAESGELVRKPGAIRRAFSRWSPSTPPTPASRYTPEAPKATWA